MKIKNTFRISLTLSWLGSVLAIILIFSTRSQLPDALRSYLHTRQPSLGLASALVFLLLVLILLSSTIASIVGAYLWRPWARSVFTMAVLFGWCISIPMGYTPAVHTCWVDIASGIASFFSGMTVCAMWFVPGVEDQFQRKQFAQQTAAASPVADR